MSNSRTLLRKLDLDLIDRLEAGGKPVKRASVKRKSEPRDASEYRGARRNAAHGFVWKNSFTPKQASRIYLDGTKSADIRLNRSRHHKYAGTYEIAREQSPSAEPVR